MEGKKLYIYFVLACMLILIALGARTNLMEGILGTKLEVLGLDKVFVGLSGDSSLYLDSFEIGQDLKDSFLFHEVSTKLTNPDQQSLKWEKRDLKGMEVRLEYIGQEASKEHLYIFPQFLNYSTFYNGLPSANLKLDGLGPSRVKKSKRGYRKFGTYLELDYEEVLDLDPDLLTEVKVYPVYEMDQDNYQLVAMMIIEIYFEI